MIYIGITSANNYPYSYLACFFLLLLKVLDLVNYLLKAAPEFQATILRSGLTQQLYSEQLYSGAGFSTPVCLLFVWFFF